MNITDRVAYDIGCMREYFRQLFSFAESSGKSFVPESLTGTQFLPLGIAHLIRPDMACNIYSLVDFWLVELCAYHQRRGKLSEGFDKFKETKKKAKGERSDLHLYARYLCEIASLDLSECQSSFDHLDALREVRNILIHAGGHVPDKKRTIIERIPDISIQTSLVVITEPFMFQSLNHANQYLHGVANAKLNHYQVV